MKICADQANLDSLGKSIESTKSPILLNSNSVKQSSFHCNSHDSFIYSFSKLCKLMYQGGINNLLNRVNVNDDLSKFSLSLTWTTEFFSQIPAEMEILGNLLNSPNISTNHSQAK